MELGGGGCLVRRQARGSVRKTGRLAERPARNLQHGFLESKSTETAIHTLTHFVETNFSKGMSTAAVFLDISGAFDSAWPPSILQALINKKCPLYLKQLISSFQKKGVQPS